MSLSNGIIIKQVRSDPLLAEETFGVYKDVQAAMIQRYGSGFVQNLPDKTGFSMQWWMKRTGKHAKINVFMDTVGEMQIEFIKNLGYGILMPVTSEDESGNVKIHPTNFILILSADSKLIVGTNTTNSFIFGRFTVRQNAQAFTAKKNLERAISLLEKLLQG